MLLLVAAEAGRQGRERREESQNDGGAERHKTTVTARAFGPFCPLRQTSGEHQEQTRESEGRALLLHCGRRGFGEARLEIIEFINYISGLASTCVARVLLQRGTV